MASESEAAVDHSESEDRKEPQLYIVSLVRKWQTRGLRRRPGGKRHRFNQLLCGGQIRLLRGKSRPLPIELLHQFREDLADRMRTGQIDIRIGGPNGKSIGLPEDGELPEMPHDDSPETDAPEESQASAAGAEAGVEASEGESEEEPEASEEVEETPEDDESAEAEELEEDEPEDEPEEDEDVEEEPEEAVIPEPSKPLDRMNKAELIDYCVQVTGMDAADLEPMVKREILEAIQGALES